MNNNSNKYFKCNNVFCNYYNCIALYADNDNKPNPPTCTVCNEIHEAIDNEEEIFFKVLPTKD